MPDEDTVLHAIAVVDRLRQSAAATAPSLALLADVMAARGARQHEISRVLGVSAAVRAWCHDQHDLLANGDQRQQTILAELLKPVPPCDLP
jgi:hypothetical protein